jgi:hypothetical protein
MFTPVKLYREIAAQPNSLLLTALVEYARIGGMAT